MRKILILTNIFPDKTHPYRGIFIKEQIEQLKDKYEIQVLFPIPIFAKVYEVIYRWFTGKRLNVTLNLDLQPNGYTVRKVYYLYIPYLSHFLKLFFLYMTIILDKWRPDFLLTYYGLENGYLATKLGKLLNKPAVIYTIGSDINCFFSQDIQINQEIKDRAIQALNNCQKIIAVSHDLKRKIIKLGIGFSKIEVIPFGVDHRIFYPLPQKQARQNLNLSLSNKIILYIGSLALSKGLFYLIQSFKKVKDKLPNTQLILVGEDYDKDTLLNLTNALDLEKDIKFIDSKPHEEIKLWMAAADVICLPSFSEGMPLVIEEALCCGRPTVATNVGGVGEVIKEHELGILVEKKNIAELSEALYTALKRQWNAAKILSAGKQFYWKKTIPKLIINFNSLN